MGHQVLQGVLAQYCEKGIGRAVQYSSEAAVGQQAARSAMVNACDHTVVLFPDGTVASGEVRGGAPGEILAGGLGGRGSRKCTQGA